MANLRVQRRRADGKERGASLVEFALVMPLLFLLLLGTLTGGLTLSRQNSVKNAVREGTRFGAVNPVDSTDPYIYLGQVLDQTKAAATGDLDNNTAGKELCAAYTDTTTTFWRVIESGSGSRTTSTGTTAYCFIDSRPADQPRVQVSARRDSSIEALLFSTDVTLSSQSVTRYER